MVKLDLGCGKADSPEGFTPVDITKWRKGVKVVDLRKRWPWKNESVDEVHCRHVLQYLTGRERVHFFNELARVLKKDGKAQIIVPHWCANRAHADPDVVYPPVTEEFLYHLNGPWREANAYWVRGFECDFEFTAGYTLHPSLATRNQEYQQNAIMFWKEAAQDLVATLTKR